MDKGIFGLTKFDTFQASCSFAHRYSYTGIALIVGKSEFNLEGIVGQFVVNVFDDGKLIETSGGAIIDGTHKGFSPMNLRR